MSGSHFLSVTDTAALVPVEADGERVALQWSRLAPLLDRAAPGAAALFAEPVAGARPENSRQISWYTRHEGVGVAFPALPLGERAAAGAALAAAVRALEPLLRDREIGSLLGRALIVPGLDDIWFVAGNPVLRNWGFAPPGTRQDDAALYRLFRAGVGSFAELPRAPWRLSEAAATAVPPPLAHEDAAVPPLQESAAPPAAWYRRPVPALAVMTLVALAVGAASWFGFSSFVGALTPAELAEMARLDTVNGVYRERTGAFSQIDDHVLCTPAAADTAPVEEAALRRHLAHGVAWVLTPGDRTMARGAAFFVTHDVLATRSRVIAGADPADIRVAAPALGGVFNAQVIAQDADFALLRIPLPKSDVDVLTLSPTLGLATPAFAGSYPSFVNPRDGDFVSFVGGEMSEAPVLVMTKGVVDVKADSHAVRHSVPVWKGSVGAPLVDACGRVVGLVGEAGTGPIAPLIDFLKANKVAFAENDLPCLAAPVLADAKPAPAP